MIGHIVLLVGFLVQLRLIGLGFRHERDDSDPVSANRWRKVRLALTIGIPFPMLLSFFVWWIEYSRAMAVVLVMMESMPIGLMLWFVLRIMYSINGDEK